MMKKIMALILSICMMLLGGNTAFANEVDTEARVCDGYLYEETTDGKYMRITSEETGDFSTVYELENNKYSLIDENGVEHIVEVHDGVGYFDGVEFVKVSQVDTVQSRATGLVGYDWTCMGSYTAETTLTNAIFSAGKTAILAAIGLVLPAAVSSLASVFNWVHDQYLSGHPVTYFIYQNFMRMIDTYNLQQKYKVYSFSDANHQNLIGEDWTPAVLWHA